jgi:A/G-specific adenine glycosylase
MDGRIPDTVAELLKLPGIGRYTAGAIASLAFERDAPILDGNVKRVLSRLFALDSRSGRGGDESIPARPVSDDALWMLSAAMLPLGRAGEWNEALMDLGATICTPRAPRCAACPVRAHCQAFARGTPEAYPAKAQKPRAPHHDVATLIIKDPAGRVLLGQRPQDGLLGGLWEFISTPFRADTPAPLALDPAWPAAYSALAFQRAGLSVEVCQDVPLRTVKHAFTHFKITRHIALAECAEPGAAMPQSGPDPYQRLLWANPDETQALALTRSDQKIRALI